MCSGWFPATLSHVDRRPPHNREYEYHLYDAVEAAHYFLNIPNDEAKIRMDVVPTQNKKRVVIRITFLTDGGQRMIEMVQPWGENGIWIPQNYLDAESDSTEISENAEGSVSSTEE